MKQDQMIGKKFDRLTVIKLSEIKKYPNLTVYYYLCVCDCGKRKRLKKYNLTKHITKSCGCIRKEKSRDRWLTHGQSKSRIYGIWAGIKERCTNKNQSIKNKKLDTYKNISISREWLDFNVFLRDMGQPPTNKHQIDRINTHGDYEKGNCRWATPSENMLNQRRNYKLVATYKKLNAIVPYKMFRKRIKEQKWDYEKAALTPKMKNQFTFINN